MEKPSIHEVKNFLEDLIVPFYGVERDMRVPLANRRPENDAEHSWSVEMLSCWLSERLNLKLDKGKIALLAMVHDLLEIGAGGDTSIWDKENIGSKIERERAAFERLKIKYSDQSWLIELIEEYEQKATPEDKFVYSVDKLMAITMRLVDNEAGNHFYIEEKPITMEEYIEGIRRTRQKAQAYPSVGELYEEVYQIFLTHPDWFA